MTTAATNTDTKNLRDQIGLVVKTKDTNTAGCGNFNGTQLYTGTPGGRGRRRSGGRGPGPVTGPSPARPAK